MPRHAPIREPQLARVALDDVEQVEPERGARMRGGALPHGARGARARAALRRRGPGAGCPGRGRRSAVGSGSRIASPSATSVSPARTRTPITRRPPATAIRVASKSRIAPSATGARNETRHSRRSVASPPHSASTTNADARAAVHAPWAIGRDSPAIRAARTERWSGLRSPPTRANASIEVGAESSAVARVRAGRAWRSGPAGASRASAAATGLRGRGVRGRRRRAAAGRRAADAAPAATRRRAAAAAARRRRRGGGRRRGRGERARRRAARRRRGVAPRIVAISSPSRSIVPVADQRGSPPCGTSIVVSARTCRTSPAASSDAELQPGLGGEEVGVAGLGQRELEVVEIAAAQGERGRGRVAEDRELGLDVGDRSARAAHAGRGSAAASARRRDPRARRAGAYVSPASPGRGGQAGPGVTACEAWTSSDSRAASSG